MLDAHIGCVYRLYYSAARKLLTFFLIVNKLWNPIVSPWIISLLSNTAHQALWSVLAFFFFFDSREMTVERDIEWHANKIPYQTQAREAAVHWSAP